MKKIALPIIALLTIFLLAFAPEVLAASDLSLSPASGSYVLGTVFPVTVIVDTGGNAINAAQANLTFDKKHLTVESINAVSITKGGPSIFNTWVDEPFADYTNGTITFAGGVRAPFPNPGYTGDNGTIFIINFKGIALGTGEVNFNNIQPICPDDFDVKRPICVKLNNGSSTEDFKPDQGSKANGGIYTIIAPPPSPLTASCSASPASTTINQEISFSASASGGEGSYTYSWSGACTGYSSSCKKYFSTIGTKTATATVTSKGKSASASCTGYVFTPGLNVSCASSASSVDAGNEAYFTATAFGGGGEYAYSWSNACTGSSNRCTTKFDTPGLKTATVTVTSDGKGASANCFLYVNTVCPTPPEEKKCKDEDEAKIQTVVVGEINNITKTVKEILNNPVASGVTKVVSTLGVAVAVASIPYSWAGLLRALGVILSAFGLKRKYIPWGVVYDSVTKQPLDPAYVILKDLQGKTISSAITDIDGRYGFLTEPGKYIISVNKTNYLFPSKKLAGRASDEMYDNLYFGQEFEIDRNEVATRNIPMDPLNFDWNEYAKKNKKIMKFYSHWDLILREFSDLIYFIGFFVAIVAFWVAPYPYNTIILGLYLFILLLRILGVKPRPYGSVFVNNSPLAFAILRISDPDTNIEVSRRVTDKYGKFFCLVPRGRYVVKIEKKNDDGSYSHIFTSPTIDAKRSGIIKNKFKL